MRLVSLEIHGFKSFADSQKLVFPGGMTAVVGPNGCGKSNIADALAWVLGEQRASLLRGTEMADVIFAGTNERKAMGMAEAKLILEMYDQIQPGTLNEVTISRRLFRDTGSEYRINGRECRLKDIQDLLLDTGMGTRAYSFIQQGQIDHLLSSKPKDRRLLLEEAAGIMRYKLRRLEAEKRLEDIKPDLQRLEDIILEKNKQRDSLRRQASKTRRALELDQEIRDTQRILLTGKAMEKEVAKDSVGQNLDGLKVEIARLTAQAAEKASEVERQRMASETLREQQECLIQQITTTDVKLSLLEQEQGDKKERSKEAGDDAIKIKERIAGFDKEDGGARLTSELEHLRAKVEITQVIFDKLEIITKKIDEDVALASGSLRTVESELKSLRIKRDEAMNTFLRQQEARRGISIQISQIEGRLETLNHEEAMRAPEFGRLEKELQQLLKEIEESEKRFSEMQEAVVVQSRLCEEATDELRACENRYRETSGALDAEELRLNQLSDALKSVSSSKASEEALNWLRGRGINPVLLTDALRIEEEARNDLERVLGIWISAVAWNLGAETLKQVPGQLMASVEFCDVPVPPPSQTQPLMKSIRWKRNAPKIMSGLLTRVFRCSDEAFFDLATIHPEYAFVSPTYVKLPFGPVHMGIEPPTASPLKIIAERDNSHAVRQELLDRLEEVEKLRKVLSTCVADARETLKGMEEDLNTARHRLEDKKGQRASIGRQIKDIEEAKQRADAQWESYESEMSSLRNQIRKIGEESPESVGIALEAEISATENQQSEAQSCLDGCREALMAASEKKNTAWSERDTAAREYQYLQRAMYDSEKTKKRLAEELAETEERQRVADDRITEIELDIQKLLNDRTKNINEQESVRPKIEHAKELLLVRERELREFQEALNNANQIHQESTVVAAEIEGDLKAIAKEVELKLNMSINEFLNSITQAEKEAWERDQLAHGLHLEVLQTKRTDLGSVNPLAIQELEEVESHLNYTNTQKADVMESIVDLEATIQMINAESEERFREAYDFINARFQEVFRQVFDGGSAYLSLQDPKDILECGIEITAQPPGKTAKVLTLLSGGEKALTAISLLFAIFHYKPSPFCVLDEVDAPLDEANVGRFAALVKNMKEHTQFIVVTHQKPTMIAADTLYGVTMEEKGISRLVSVQLKEAENLIET